MNTKKDIPMLYGEFPYNRWGEAQMPLKDEEGGYN